VGLDAGQFANFADLKEKLLGYGSADLAHLEVREARASIGPFE
jgi:hypothetical protein